MNKEKSYLQLGKFFPPDWGGIETVSYNLLTGLTQQGVKNAALVFGDSNCVENFPVGNSSAKVFRASHFKIFNTPMGLNYFFTFRKIASTYDIVVVHLPNPFAAIVLALSGYKGRVVLYWHSDVVNKGLLGVLIGPLERWIISRADVVIGATSAHLEHSRYASLFSTKGKFSPYPILPDLVSVAEKCREVPRVLVANKIIRILAIGRLVEYKGLEYLIRAIPCLSGKYVIQVDILGDGPLRESLESLIVELGLSQSVFLRGSVSEVEREQYLLESDIFCFPSITKQEMYGMVQIEAMAYGLPIISTEIVGSGSPELTRMTGAGVVIPPCSIDAISNAVEKLISDPALYSNLSIAGLDAITHLFRPSVLVEDFQNCCV